MKTPTKKTGREFSATQTMWMLAKAQAETIRAAYKAATAHLSVTAEMTEAECEVVWAADDAIRAAHGVDAAEDTCRAAEMAMVRWAHAEAMKCARGAQVAELAGLVDSARRFPKIWEKMVDSAARLAA